MSCDGRPACQQLRELQYPEYPGPFSQTYITTGRRARAHTHTHTPTRTHTQARAPAREKDYIDTALVGISTEPGHPG